MSTPTADTTLRLRLYVAGNAPNSVRAIANATTLCDAHFAGAYHLEIVDLLEAPDRAFTDGIVVTPTLLRMAPSPAQRIIGNLSDTEQVLVVLSGRRRKHE